MPDVGHGSAAGVIGLDDLALKVRAAAKDRERLIVAIAAPPGAGKSTLAEELADRLGPEALVVPMDGFHLDNAILQRRGLLARKGAPETFDGAGFAVMIGRLRREAEVTIPVFDRARDIAIAGATLVEARHRILLVEGNYLLLDSPPWDALAPLWDLTLWLEVPLAVLEKRLVQRWQDGGMDPAAARGRALGNDIPNARMVIAGSRKADVTVRNG